MHLVAIGGSDAGISAALRARELDPSTDVTVVVADAYPNFSICGIPYYVSGEVAHWQNLAHRSYADLEATGMRLRLDTVATRIDVAPIRSGCVAVTAARSRFPTTASSLAPGPSRSGRPSRASPGPAALGEADGVHLLHTMGDTFALRRSLDELRPASALIVGAGYVGLEMADGLTVRGLRGLPGRDAARGPPHRRPRAGGAGPGRAGGPGRRRSRPLPPCGAWLGPRRDAGATGSRGDRQRRPHV